MFLAVLNQEKKTKRRFEIPFSFTGGVPVLRETGIWICSIGSWVIFFFPPP